ncbi:hypothetical protein DFH27DRAFT_565678 [Peziza echinospora]|nr:hypothetical protein DFH27DRAFT_565678 [Peziza echinospora]
MASGMAMGTATQSAGMPPPTIMTLPLRPDPHKGMKGPGLPLFVGVATTFIVLSSIAVALRFYVRIARTQYGLKLDDYLALAAVVLLAAHGAVGMSTMVIGLRLAAGARNVSYTQLQERFRVVIRLAKVLIVVYQFAAMAVQLSIIALCIRISPRPGPATDAATGRKTRGMRVYRAAAYTLGAVCAIAATVRAVVDVTVPGVWYFTFAFTLVLDSVIWLLPLPLVYRYMRRSSPGKRLLATAMFAAGLAVCAVAAGRMAQSDALNGADCGEACAWLTVFDQIEVGLAILCACMPPLQPLLIGWAKRASAWCRGKRAAGGRAGEIAMASTSGWGSRIARAGERRRFEAKLEGRIKVGRGPKGELEIDVEGMGILGSALPPPPAALLAAMNGPNAAASPEPTTPTITVQDTGNPAEVYTNHFSASSDTILSHYPPLSASRELVPTPHRSDEALNRSAGLGSHSSAGTGEGNSPV